MRIVINGFGRIGRTILRQILTSPNHSDIDVALINDIAPLQTCAYLLKYDSTFGPLPYEVITETAGLRIKGIYIPFSQHATPQGADFPECDVLLECTGKLNSREMTQRGLAAGARSVLISGPSEFADTTAVLGANEETVGQARIVSNSSCTTNAIGPMMRALDAALGINHAHITTIHCYTGSQPMVDAPRGDLARSRAGAESMVPTTTSAAKELRNILPDLGARTSVAALRVPSLSVSALDATLQISRKLPDNISNVLRDIAAQSPVIGTIEDPCVSRDMRGRAESLIIALPQTQTIGDNQLRIFGWYDNEWGFSARMIEMARLLSAR